MALVVRLTGPDDLGEIVEALLTAADAKQTEAPDLATRWRALAHDVGDALDQLPQPTQ
ncbi:hypothetical protein [Streptomyces scabiei]|uniref:hypothetical protein n=1 Tax=Streptomyces scabiei TaxID=1930 RepID=UPI001B3005A9|nr:hypothetical protein [Streptomyces sp. LBUM 1475]